MDHHEKVTQLLQALGDFKDWSNYLLVTTVAALGWVAAHPTILPKWPFRLAILFFGISIIFAIFTLALIPIIGENITPGTDSIYTVSATFKICWFGGSDYTIPTLKLVCWPQHVLFLFGITVFCVGSIWKGPAKPTNNAGG